MSTNTETKLLKDLRVADLKLELEKRGQVTSGVKAVLVERLQSLLKEEGHDPEAFDFNATSNDSEEAVDKTQDETTAIPEEPTPQQPTEDNVEANEVQQDEPPKEEQQVEAEVKNGIEDGKEEDDSINIMLDEGEDFDEKDKEDTSLANTLPKTASPPRPETAPVVQPFTSRDTISLASLNKAPSENSSMRVAIDESESVGTQESLEGKEEAKGAANGDSEDKDKAAENDSRYLWVSGLSSNIRAADLKAAFAKIGKVSAAKVVASARTPGAKCYGYVTMSSAEEAVKCLELSKTELNGKIITVERAKPDAIAPTSKNAQEPLSEAKREDSKPRDDKETASTSKEKPSEEKREGGGRSSRDRSDRRDHRDHRHRSKDHHRSRSPIRFPANPPSNSGSTSSSSGSNKRPIHERLSFRSPERVDKPPKPGVLTFAQIREERERERAREEDRRRRQRDRERREEEDRRQREIDRKRRAEEETIRREREELRREREKIEREKAELMRLERERQRLERERLQREKEELERLRRQQTSRMEDARRGTKRGLDDSYYDHDRGKRSSGSSGNGSRYESSSSSSSRYESRYDDRRYPSSSGSSSRGGDYHHHRDSGPPRGGVNDHRSERNNSSRPWGGPPAPPSGAPGPSSSSNKPPYPPLMGSSNSGVGSDWGSSGRSSGGPQPPQPPILSGGPSIPAFGNSSAPSSSGMGYGGRGGGQYSSSGNDRFNNYKPGGSMMGGGGRRY